jgi:hypothetical protein
MASIRDWPGDVTALAVGHVIGTVIVARAARASGRVCPASHSIIVTMGFASPATVLLWVLALRPAAGPDAIMTQYDIDPVEQAFHCVRCVRCVHCVCSTGSMLVSE